MIGGNEDGVGDRKVPDWSEVRGGLRDGISEFVDGYG